MGLIEKIHGVTEQILNLLETDVNKETEGELIEDLQKLLEQREVIIKSLPKLYSEEELINGIEIVELNKMIDKKLETLFQEIQADLRNIKQSISTNKKYSNPYENLSIDGMFFDKRK